jgi:phosphopantothenoylcysteine synthetase/decarboxylase
MNKFTPASHTTCEIMLGVKMMKKLLVVTVLFLGVHLFGMTPASAEKVGPVKGITLEKAKQIAMKQVKGKVVSAKVEKDDGMTKYEIIVQAKDGKYEVEIDKSTGKVLEVEKETHKGSGRNGIDGNKHKDHDDDGDHDDHDDHDDDHDDHDDSNDD